MKFSTRVNQQFAHAFWNPLPAPIQREFSKAWSVLYKTRASTLLIEPFCRRYRLGVAELNRYLPSSGGSQYLSFQDFFTRQLATPLVSAKTPVWPCQGYVCESGRIADLGLIGVKGENHNARFIFNRSEDEISDNAFFVNIFLHNHNYHRFHSPVSGVIKKIEFLPGELRFLRPWLYPHSKVSEPAFRNERVVVEIEDTQQGSWFMSFVGGMGVGQIKLDQEIKVGASIRSGQEMGLFLLGSTCCMAIPKEIPNLKYMTAVEVGRPLFSEE